MELCLWRAHSRTRRLHSKDLYSIDTPGSIIVRKILLLYTLSGIFFFFLLKLWNFTLLFYPLFYCWLSVKFSTGCCHKLFPLCVPSVVWWQMTSFVSSDSKFTCHFMCLISSVWNTFLWSDITCFFPPPQLKLLGSDAVVSVYVSGYIKHNWMWTFCTLLHRSPQITKKYNGGRNILSQWKWRVKAQYCIHRT